MRPKYFTLSLLCSSILVGCGADDRAYETEPRKPEQVLKTDIKTDQVYLYMPSMAKAPRYAVSMAPFMQGQEKLVRLIFTKKGLEVRKVSPDVISQAQLDNNDFGRWDDVPTDLSPIIFIPGEYQEYRCEEDDYGDCTNKEEENEDDNLTWIDKSFFTPKYEKLKVIERDWDDLFTHSTGCYTPVKEAKLPLDWTGYEIAKDGSINIEIEQDYQITNEWRCLINALFQGEDGLNFDDLTFTVSNHYSFVPLNAIRSKDYEPILYPKGDEDTFGMFATQVSRPDHLGNNTQDGNRIHYMHRFNPDLKTIDYHLSDSFDLNESTKFYKQITIDVIERINPQLAKVGVPQIKLHEPSGKRSGDLRYNVINLIDEPLQNGLAGYGPSAVNPVTGEIVHAHVNQYAGVLEAIAHIIWDRIAAQYNRGNVTPMVSKSTANTAPQPVTHSQANQAAGQYGIQSKVFTHDETVLDAAKTPLSQSIQTPLVETVDSALKGLDELQRIPEEDITLLELTEMHQLEKRLWAEHNMFPVSSLWASATNKMLPDMVVAGKSIDFYSNKSYVWKDDAKTQLKNWSELTIEQQTHVGQILTGIYYAKTLVHELGHNLGLRHNFKGSNDDQNFFSKQQAHDHGLKYVPAYSSIMDYNPSMLDALPVFGLYDKAALRFAYKRQVEYSIHGESETTPTTPQYYSLDSYDKALHDEFFSKDTHLSERLSDGVLNAAVYDGVLDDKWSDKANGDKVMREYMFCTDENVSLNTDCNRHDEGRNRGEINSFSWQRYYEQHDMRTVRNGRKNFDEATLEKYAVGRINTFMGWRENIQEFDRLAQYIDWSDAYRIFISKTDPVCTGANQLWPVSDFMYDFYCGIPQGIDELRSNLIQLVIQPDHLCEVKDKADAISYQRLSDIISESKFRDEVALKQGEVPQSCFHPAVSSFLSKSELTVTAEAGRMLNSTKAPKVIPKFNYVGMFDYYGFWTDKFAAMATLLERDGIRRTTDRTDTALADLPYLYHAGNGNYQDADIFKMLLNDIALGTNFTQINFYPDLFRDSEGKGVAPQGNFVNFDTDTMVEAAPYYARSLKRFYDLPAKNEYSEIKALLNLVVKFRHSETGEFTSGNELARYVSIRSTYEHAPSIVEFERKDGRLYYANSDNYLAHRMITTLKEFKDLNDPNVDNKALELKFITLEQFNNAEQHAQLVKTIERYNAVLELLPIYNW